MSHVVVLTLSSPGIGDTPQQFATRTDVGRVLHRFRFAVRVREVRVQGRHEVRVTCPTGRGDRGAARLRALACAAWIPVRP